MDTQTAAAVRMAGVNVGQPQQAAAVAQAPSVSKETGLMRTCAYDSRELCLMQQHTQRTCKERQNSANKSYGQQERKRGKKKRARHVLMTCM